MLQKSTYLLSVFALVLISLTAINRPVRNHEKLFAPPLYQYFMPQPDTNDLIYPFKDQPDIITEQKPESPLFLHNPSNITPEVQYDPETGEYTIMQKIGSFNYRTPYSMPMSEYLKWDQERAVRQYWFERAKQAGGGTSNTGIIPQIFIGGQLFERIFGSGTIDIRPQGSAELTFGVLANRRDDPTLNVRQRKVVNFDFQQRIQMSVLAKIGDKIEFQANYNTEATFDFENKLNLKYEGKEDEIIQLIEAGNVTLPLNSVLITGSQALFGIKTKLKFGRTTVTAVYSEQESETQNITVQGGAQTNNFLLNSDEYEENKHYLLAQYFRNNYDIALSELPLVRSNINITKIEVWVTNIGAAVTQNRNIIAFQDLGEPVPYSPSITGKSFAYPDNMRSNNLMEMLMQYESQVRDINTVASLISSPPFSFSSGIDAVKVESARKLSPSEFSFNSKVGFISLNTTLNPDQVLAVAFQYNVIGDSTIYQVGEFSDEGIDSPKTLIVKLLKSNTLSTKVPVWNLMMKNVYNIGAYQVQNTDFFLNILYSGNENAVPTSYLVDAGNASGIPLIRVLNFDNLDPQQNPPFDGIFDFIDNAATQGGTIQASNGRVYFTVLEPFGSYLREKIGNNNIADQFAYDSLYTLTKNGAQQYPEKNKFILEGFYKSSSGSEISLNALNVPQGSVVVTAGGVPLVENVDYTVDYTLGRVRIMNEGVLNSGTPINISMESQSFFNVQTKRLMGTHIDYRISEDFNIGATLLNLTERPLTQKVSYGNDPISNTIWGMDVAYQTNSRVITKVIDKLPFLTAKEESRVTIDGEFAHFIPGHAKAIGRTGTSYIDDFEASKSTIDLKNMAYWHLASTPQKQENPGLFPEAAPGTGRSYGYNRAKLAWYIIDPLFYDETGSLRPGNVDLNELSKNLVRQVLETEVFPNKDVPNGVPTNIPILNLAFYPTTRGPYNYDVEGEPGISAGMNADGSLKEPESRWGGIMRRIESTNFEATNVEYIEFWMMDPFTDDQTSSGALYFNLGDISEDILRDGRKGFEHGLPPTEEVENVDTTIWGRVPSLQALVDNFSNVDGSRVYQDVGLDGLRDEDEQSFYESDFLQKIANQFGTSSLAYRDALADPSSDNYHYFRGSDYDNDADFASILNRYKQYNGPDGNSPTDEINPEGYPTSATSIPDAEDINRDNTLSESERYFQYKVEINPNTMNVGQNYISDIYTAQGIRLPNGQIGEVKWYQFKIPVSSPEKIVGGIQDFQSIRFLRMFMKGFDSPTILRFATLELVRGEWRRYRYDLLSPGEYIPNDIQSETSFDVLSINIEENGKRSPVPYVIPPGIEREVNLGTTNLQQLNEQSMVLRTCNLMDGDARGAYKTTDFDFRDYGFIEMFVHAEKLLDEQELNDGDLTLFVRFGSDLTQNYYEYEIPLKFTPWFTSFTEPDVIWPEENKLKIDLEKLVNYKLERNKAMRQQGSGVIQTMPYYVYDGPNKVTILGSPSLSSVKAIMIGVRNPKQTTLTGNDDGLPKCAEIWVNEFRLTDFNNQGGFAATARIRTDLSDFGNLSVSGLYSTPGFGSIEKKTNERAKEFTKNWDMATNLELGKFFPETFGLRIPMHFDFSESRLDPKYNLLDPDILLNEDLKTYSTRAEKDSIRKLNQDYVMRKNINFINVRKIKTGASTKTRIYDIENWGLTYSYSEISARNVDFEYDIQKKYLAGIGYNFNNNPKNYKPFSGIKFLNSKVFSLIKDFNFYLMPKLFSFRTDMNREYNKRLLRNKSQYAVIIEPTYLKKWDWTRNYTLNWDFATSLRLDYRADVLSYIDELPGSIEKDDPDYEIKKDQRWDQISNLGTKSNFNHTIGINYTIPINKVPLLDWVNATARYQANYRWQASPISLQERLGNQIENSNTVQLNGNLSLDRLYDKIPGLKNVNQPKKPARPGGMPRPGTPKPEEKPLEDSTAKVRPDYFRIAANTILKILTGFKRASLAYSEGNGIFLPGFIPQPGIVGNNWDLNAPGYEFVLGSQRDIRFDAVANGWLTTDTLLNTAYATKHNEQINFRGTIEPFTDFKIELTADRTYSLNHQEYFKADASGTFNSFSPIEQGSFSMSFLALKTAWEKDNDKDQNPNFEKLKENRLEIANRLAAENPNWNKNIVDSTGFPEGYGPSQQDVLLYSFLSAYSGKSASSYQLNLMPKIPQLNWRLTYNGLARLEFFKKFLRNFTIAHGYRTTYSINSFQSNLLYQSTDNAASATDVNNNFISRYQIAQVSIVEQFNPLISFDMTWLNSLMTKFELKKGRNLSLSFVNNQLTEVSTDEIVIGLGYRFKEVQFGIRTTTGGTAGTRQNVKSDLNIRADFSIRSNKTLLRRIDEDINQVSTGQKVNSLNISADYTVNSRLNLRLFYDMVLNNPYVSSQYRNSTTNAGITMRFTLAQ
ncbi:MAG TPA: cell surface protein SprA [Bacteroidales bacterium]|nr:cell surface protein SprA [Bacteroidales bacterium]